MAVTYKRAQAIRLETPPRDLRSEIRLAKTRLAVVWHTRRSSAGDRPRELEPDPHLEALLRATDQLIWTSLPDGAPADAARWREFTGQTVGQMRGRGWLDAVHPDDRTRLMHLWSTARAKPTPFEGTYRVRRSDGAYRLLTVRNVPILGKGRRVSQWVSAASDVTPQPHGEALSEREQTLLDGISDGFLAVDSAGVLVYVNVQVEAVLGKPRDELIGRNVRDLFPEELAAPFYRAYERVLATGAPAAVEAYYPPFGRWYETRLYPSAEGVTIYLHDITERREANERITQALAREQAAHVEAARQRDEAEAASLQLRQLQEVTDGALSSLELSDLLPGVLERVCHAMSVESAAILLLSDDGQELVILAGIGALRSETLRIPFGRGIAGRIAATCEPLIVDDLNTVEVISPALRDQLGSIAGVPLLVQGRRIGVLQVGSVVPYAFDSQDVSLLQRVADRIALAIDHARLYELARAGYIEAEARASELTATFATMTDGVVVVDAQGKGVRINQALRTLLRIDLIADGDLPSLFDQRHIFFDVRDAQGERVPPERLPITRILAGEVLQGATALDISFRNWDGGTVDMNVTGAPVRSLDGQIVGAVAVFRDVTRRRRLERQVTEQASQLEITFDAMTDGITVFDRDGHIVRSNAADREMFGFGPDATVAPSTLGERFERISLRDEHGRPLSRDQWPAFRVLAGEDLRGSGALEVIAQSAHGREMVLSECGAPIRDQSGQITGGVLVVRDVTERRMLEHRTREALQALLDMAEVLVTSEGTRGDTAAPDTNAVVGRLAELTRSMLGCERMSFIAVDSVTEEAHVILRSGSQSAGDERVAEHDSRFVLRERIADTLVERLCAGEVVVTDAASSLFWPPREGREILLAPMRIGSRLVGLLVLEVGKRPSAVIDDTRALAGAVAQLATVVIERGRLVSEQQEARASEFASREATRRMELFLALASHEFRTPLTVIKTYLQLAQHGLADHASDTPASTIAATSIPSARECLALAHQATLRLTGLLDDLLQVSRAQAGKLSMRPELCDLASVVRTVVEDQTQIKPGRRIHLRLPRGRQVLVSADPARVGQVVTNYLSNAIKYSPDSQPIDVSMHTQGRQVRVSVHDRGHGLSPVDQQGVWERFYQATSSHRPPASDTGLGLGLYICRTIVEQHGGQIGVESTEGQGSTFWFTLPLAPTRRERSSRKSR